MINFTFNPNDYEEKDFSILPAGDYRVRISDVTEKTFKSGSTGLEIIFDVSGKSSRLWYYLTFNGDAKAVNQRLGQFFESFGITNTNVNAYASWVGKIGGVRVKHEDYNGERTAKVRFVLNKKTQDRLPAWVEPGNKTVTANTSAIVEESGDLPFD